MESAPAASGSCATSQPDSRSTRSAAAGSATAASESSSLADNLLTNLQPFNWPNEDELALVKQYNKESLTSAQKQSEQFDLVVHRWISDIERRKGLFYDRITYWTAQLFRRHPVSTHILHLQMQRSMYDTSSAAYIILLIGNILKFSAFAGSILFFFARHSPSLLPAGLRPSPEPESDTWGHFFYKYSIGLIIDKAFNTVQATVDIGYTLAIATFIWVIMTYISASLQNYSQIIQRRYSLQKLEKQFLADFQRSIQEQLMFYLKPIVFEAYKTFLAFPIHQRSQLLGTYTRQDPEMKTVHTLLLNECETMAFTTNMEGLCTAQINEKTLKHMVELGTTEYIDCYTKFITSLKDCGTQQLADFRLRAGTVVSACGSAAARLAAQAAAAAGRAAASVAGGT
jgi:hypothetical protein